MNAAVTDALPRLLPDWHVLHLAGEAGMADAGAARRRLPDDLRPRYTAEPFLTDRMADALVAADLVLGRAGSSTCAEVAAVGVASILVPYPYAGAHQQYNARYLADEGAAIMVADEDLTADRLVSEVGALRSDDARRAMADAARRLGRPDAAQALADAVIELAEGRS
jgi:UDP-N-acetylglucosamine--N-acetylmuramyl-(pentapeptide) pyrophosphoryl-undecaprenol N-acetylglucosamine transferase